MILIVDASNLAYRVKYTYNLTYGTEDVSVTYGFLSVLTSEMKKLKPSSVIICWDGGTPPFRRNLLPDYKRGRHKGESQEDRENFYRQLRILQANIPHFSMISVRAKGLEADDLIYYMTRCTNEECLIYSNDADMLQIVTSDGRVNVLSPITKKITTAKNFKQMTGVAQCQYVDYRIMLGDGSDNIKGIEGIGEKSAIAILDNYDSLTRAFKALDAGEEWKSSKLAKTRLSNADRNYVEVVRQVIDLSYNTNIASVANRAIEEALNEWKQYNPKTVNRFLLSKGFVSMLGGNMYRLYAPLRIPEFNFLEDMNSHEIQLTSFTIRMK